MADSTGADWSQPSWQQMAKLRRERLKGRIPQNLPLYLELPRGLDPDVVSTRLHGLVQQQSALRITGLSEDRVTYSTDPGGTIDVVDTSDRRGTALEYLHARASKPYPRDGHLWDCAILRETSAEAPMALVGMFDHVVADTHSLHRILKTAVTSGLPPRDPGRPDVDGYLEWIRWQRSTYVDRASESADFWKRMFDGIPGNRVVPLAECRAPYSAPSGSVHVEYAIVPEEPATSRASSRRLAATPFMTWLAPLTAAIAESAETDDVNLSVNVMARVHRHADIFGLLSNEVPVRIQGDGLHDVAAAFGASRSAWLSLLPHQEAPWNFVLEHACGEPPIQPPPMLVTLNYWPTLLVQTAAGGPAEDESGLPGINVIVSPSVQGYVLKATADTNQFSRDGLSAFVSRIMRKREQLMSSGPPSP